MIEFHKDYLVMGNYRFFYKHAWMPIAPYALILPTNILTIISLFQTSPLATIAVFVFTFSLITSVVWRFIIWDDTLFFKITGWRWECDNNQDFVLKCSHVLKFYENQKHMFITYAFKYPNEIFILNNDDLMHLKLTFNGQNTF
jgi:hypothetical protein